MRRLLAVCAALLSVALLVAPALGEPVRHEVHFPSLPGYQTLVCDLHMHSVFSDGEVWPTVRVDEAYRLGYDAIALSDHIEYKPHKDDVTVSLNRSYELAVDRARTDNILFPRAAEITRETPPGHFNALFLKDIGPLATEDFVEQIRRANQQGAFVFWNHQDWKGAEKGQWQDVHTKIYQNKWLHGMEVVNGEDYNPTAHQWCLDKNLTMLGNTDSHTPELRLRNEPGNHRTATLVFANERTLEALKEALFAGRTAVWCKEQIIGRKEFLEPFFQGCVRVARPHFRGKTMVLVHISNTSDVPIQLRRSGASGPERLDLPAGATALVEIGTKTPDQPHVLTYTATNFLIAPKVGLPVTLKVEGR